LARPPRPPQELHRAPSGGAVHPLSRRPLTRASARKLARCSHPAPIRKGRWGKRVMRKAARSTPTSPTSAISRRTTGCGTLRGSCPGAQELTSRKWNYLVCLFCDFRLFRIRWITVPMTIMSSSRKRTRLTQSGSYVRFATAYWTTSGSVVTRSYSTPAGGRHMALVAPETRRNGRSAFVEFKGDLLDHNQALGERSGVLGR